MKPLSFSMYMEKLETNQLRKTPIWVSDSSVSSCTNCRANFNFFIRKHHCRSCGRIFCYRCSDFFIKIPYPIFSQHNKYKFFNKNNEFSVFDYNSYKTLWKTENNDKERVCQKCLINIVQLSEIDNLILIFGKLPLDIRDYYNINLVCKKWNRIAQHLLGNFFEIQYLFPDHNYTQLQSNMIYNNRLLLTGHSKWVLQFILSTDWNKISSIEKDTYLRIIRNPNRDTSCWSMMCTRYCSNKLQFEDIIIILSKKITFLPLIKHLIHLLYYADENELSCYLTWIVNSLHFYKDYSIICHSLENFCLKKANESRLICNQLFWILTQNIFNHQDSYYFKHLRQKLVNQMDSESYKLFQYGYDFTKNIIQIANNCGETNNMMECIKNYLSEYKFNKKFYLPVNFEKPFDGINIEKIRTIDSKTRPIILPCIYDTDKVYNVMLKKEDIRKEEIVMNIIKLMDIFLKREENLDLNVTIYNILPISHEYGYIQFVPNSHTLYTIREENKFTIQNFILERNPDIDINTFRDNFSKSCALYCVVSYLLGIGDRHLDNIMITEDGKLFHIDFAYILGRDPKVVCPEIRITPEMIDAMGGHQSRHYNLFKQYCGQAYNCIRSHSSIFYTLLLSLQTFKPPLDDNIDSEKMKQYIIQRFNLGENYRNADLHFKQKIELNCNTYSENIIDFFHKKNKSSKDNTIIIDYAKSYITSSMSISSSILSNSIMKLFS